MKVGEKGGECWLMWLGQVCTLIIRVKNGQTLNCRLEIKLLIAQNDNAVHFMETCLNACIENLILTLLALVFYTYLV